MASTVSFGDANSGFQTGTIHGPVHVEFHPNPDSPLRSLPYAKDAPFNSFAKQYDPTCLPDTRVDLLRDIYSWADGQDERCIFWLSGLAGTGKSTIARTVARRYFDQKRLGASFFFSRGGGDVGHAGKFVTSIASQLASTIPSLDQHICDALTECRDIASQSLRDQWRQLIVVPLSKLDSCLLSYAIVVDALDECDNDNNIRTILRLAAECRSFVRVQLRVFLTSRPETPIRHGFRELSDSEHQDCVLHNILPWIVNRDIRIFFEHTFELIAQERSLVAGWPGQQVIKRLLQSASGLFIWAATACRFIRNGKRFAVKRLDMILEHSSTAINAPEKHLNEIYTTVLRNCISPEYSDEEAEELQSMLKSLLGSIVTLLSPLSIQSLSKLLSTSQDEVDQTLNDLHAIINIPKDPTHPLHLHHPSFRDFLLNKDRCAEFWVDEKKAHQILAAGCIQLMSQTLKKDICEMHTPSSQASQVESSWIEKYLPPEVQYACLYWVQHLQRSGSQVHDGEEAHRFLQTHLLHWLEALGWMGKTSEGIQVILSLEAYVLVNESPNLYAFIYDAKRFALYNRLVIEQAPLQLYCSALIFAPEQSIVRETFKKCIPTWIKGKPKVQAHWSVALQTLEGHSGSVNSVAFSPDGKQVVSGSGDRTVRLWDARTGAPLQTLEGHSGWVNSVAFLPGGKVEQGLFVSNDWVVEGKGEILWLPPDYRATSTAVWNRIIVIGHSSGRISIIGFKEESKYIQQ